MLAKVLPFDDEDEKEIARQTIQDPVDFNFSPWEERTAASKDVIRMMMEKNRFKRPNIEELLNMEWFSKFKAVNDRSKQLADNMKFKAYALT